MLAVQRPRMGSSQPPDPSLPFGYSYDPSHDLFPDPPPQPARGEPLLTENDSKSLGSFFEFMSGDLYSSTSFGEGLNFGSDNSWFDMPPHFVGSTTSFGQASMSPAQLGASQTNDFGDVLASPGLMPPPPPPPPSAPQTSESPLEQHQHQHQHQQHATADVLAAATLLRNGSAGRSGDSGQRGATRTLTVPVGHLRHQGLDDFRQEGHKTLQQGPQPNEHDGHFTEMFFGSRARPTMSRQTHVGDVQWGSDSAFTQGRGGYVPPSDKETYEAMSQKQIELMQCLEVSQSAANTCPSSPVTGDNSLVKTHSRKTSEVGGQADDPDGPPRKRRKSRVKKEADEDDEESSPAPKSGRRRKSRAIGSPASNGGVSVEKAPTASKRRKSTNGAKPPRENLSEEQKRENHIRSEQKRRTLIKEGFEDLVSLVPGLQGGGFSKSSMLTTAADWLAELLDYNGQLAAHLANIQSR